MNKAVKKVATPLGKRLDALLKASNFKTIKEFEEKSGVRPDSIRRLIGGYKRKLSFEELQKVASALKMSPSELCASGDGEGISTTNLVPDAKEPCWFQVRSDEMMPTLRTGGFVLVDCAVKSVSESGIYLINTPTTQVFRRISVNPVTGNLYVDVDNKSYSYSEDVSVEKVQVAGRVVGVFQRI